MEIKDIVKDNFLVFEHDVPLSEAVGKLQQSEKHAGIVFRNKKYLGLVEKRKLITVRVNPTEAKISNYVRKVPLIDEETEVIEAARLLVNTQGQHLPVEKKKEIIGVINTIDLLKLSLTIPEISKLKVKDTKIIKSKKINKDDLLSTAIEFMHNEHADHLPVFDKGKFYGVLSYKDILRKHFNWSSRRDVSGKFNFALSSKEARSHFPPLDLPVENFSTNDNIFSITSKSSLKDAISLMEKHKVHSLLIMDGDDYQGLLSARNILETATKQKKPQNFSINIKGLHDVNLTEHQESAMLKIIERESEKLQRKVSYKFSVSVHLKETSKEGKQKEFEVKFRITAPGNRLATTKSSWDLETAIHKCFNVVKAQLER